MIDRLSGDEDCKARFKAFLQTMTGQCTVPGACQELGIEQSRFFALRSTWLQESLNLLEPKPRGRPRKATPDEPQMAELKQQMEQLQQQLRLAELRAQLAEAGVTPPSRQRRKKGAPR
ncbi:MAG TPA: hypothetical protein VFW33_11185 [Gemmataceae bacterium]|nr:hypothetical protein [Gemmataceae bacterium]